MQYIYLGENDLWFVLLVILYVSQLALIDIVNHGTMTQVW